jgi:hypothetical protein
MKYNVILREYACKGKKSMSLEDALHYITEMYMEQCGVSLGLRTVIYEAGEMLFEILLSDKEWKLKIGESDYLFEAMTFFHSEYTLEKYEDYDITYLSKEDRERCIDLVIEELCVTNTGELQLARPYECDDCEQKMQAFCWGISLLLGDE